MMLPTFLLLLNIFFAAVTFIPNLSLATITDIRMETVERIF